MALVGRSEVASALNLSERRIDQLVHEGMPRVSPGKYELGPCMAWYIRRLQMSGVQGDGPQDPDKLDPFKRRAHYQGELDKMKLELERGELVPRAEVERGHAAVLKLVTQCFETIPDLVERDCGANPTMITRIERRLDEVRRSLYTQLVESDADGTIRDGVERKTTRSGACPPAKADKPKRGNRQVPTN